jgi:hypothetical protein
MKTRQYSSNNKIEIHNYISNYDLSDESLVFIFSDKQFLTKEISKILKDKFKDIPIIACSTSGEIVQTNVFEGSFTLTTVSFVHSYVRLCSFKVSKKEDSFLVGSQLVDNLLNDELKHIFVLSDGLNVNGTNLVNGINSVTNGKVSVSGGLAGDGVHFNSTLVSDESGDFCENIVTAIGLYGDRLNVNCSSEGGWEIFGKERIVTKSDENIVYEIDHKPALDLYKVYLGDKAKYLPSSGLLFPLSLETADGSVVRTILGVNEAENSIRFAGNIPENSSVRLMKTNIDSVLNAAELASLQISRRNEEKAGLVILVSCIGRKLVLKQIVQEEVELVSKYFSEDFSLTGFYSYGELSSTNSKVCSLHNQTMTLTLITEK